MDGIISGKIEKPIGSIIFTPKESATLPSDWTSIEFSNVDEDNTYLRFIDKMGNVTIIKWSSLKDLNTDTQIAMVKETNDSAYVYIKAYNRYSTIQEITFSDYKRWDDYCASVEIGTIAS